MTLLQLSRHFNIETPSLGYASAQENILDTFECSKYYKERSVVKLYLDYSDTLRKKTTLRSRLFALFVKCDYFGESEIKFQVEKFIKDIGHKRPKAHYFLMHQTFLCKCGSLLYNPSTLPCGHTMCKHCADENMFCIYCGYTIDDLCNPNLFLVQILSSWFPEQYESAGHKRDAMTLCSTEDYELALNEIDISIELYDQDFMAFQIRAEIHIKLKEYKQALSDASKACELNKECGKSQFVKANCYSFLGKINEAIDAFQLCLELEPEDMALHSMVISRLDDILSLPDTGSKLTDSDASSSDEGDSSSENSEDQKSNKANNKSCNNQQLSNHLSESIDQKSISSNPSQNLEPCNNSHDRQRLSEQSLTEGQLLKTESSDEEIHGVPKSLVKDDDFECKLCYELLFQPITTTCGHVFCKNCLLRSLDHNVSCPICRLSLDDFLKNPLKPVTTILENILELFFIDQFNERKRIYNEKMERLSRVGEDENVEIPVFVCSIAFPYVKCPLHIFEPKYRLMIRECIESGSKKFGMCVPQGSDDHSDIGTVCKITKIQTLPDGRYIINATAGQRFLVKEKITRDSLNYAKVKYFRDEPEDLTSEIFTRNARSIYDGLSQYMSSLNETEQDCIFNALGRLPPYDGNYERYQHGVPWVWWGLAALPLNFQAKLVLLRSKCVSERMLSLQRFLRFLTRMRTPQSRESVAVSSAH